MGHWIFNAASRGLVIAPFMTLAGCQTTENDTQTSAIQPSAVQSVEIEPYLQFQYANHYSVFRTTGLTSGLAGAYDFCARHPQDCGRVPQNKFYRQIDSATWQSIHDLSQTLIQSADDNDIYGVPEFWAYPDQGVGDCEDYQLYNRRRAVNHYGVNPLQLMFIAVMHQQADGTSSGHLVQAAQTRDQGWMVSDNLSGDIYALNEIYQRYPEILKISFNIGEWYDIEPINRPSSDIVTAAGPVSLQP